MHRFTDRITPPAPASTADSRRRSRWIAGVSVLALFLPASGVRAETAPGNVLNPEGLEAWRRPDERGMTLLQPARRRTPTGFLYPYPPVPPAYRSAGPWLYRGVAEIGAFFDGGDETESRFERHAEWTDEVFVSGLTLEILRPERGDYLELSSGGLGRNDQFWRLEAGRAGWLRIRGSFSRAPRRFAADARVLFQNPESEYLSLPASLSPGSNTGDQIRDALAATPESTLELRRDRTRLSIDLRPREGLNLFARYGFEKRKGARPFGLGFSFPQLTASSGGVVETTEPLDERTHDVSAGLEFSGRRIQANLAYSGSFYRNRHEALVVENPLDLGGVETIARARLALAPSNQAHGVKGDLAIALPLRSRFKATLSWGTMRQDERLLPPTISDNTLFGIPLTDWNTTSALSQTTVGAEIHTFLLDTGVFLNPWKPLKVRARFRYYDQDNDTSYTARNPLTGEYGYIVEDGGLANLIGPAFLGIFQGTQGDFPYRSIPFATSRRSYEVSGSLRLEPKTSLTLSWKREDHIRDHREFEKTREDRIRIGLTSRRLRIATARLSYEFASREAREAKPDYHVPFFFSSLPGFSALFPEPRALAQLRRPELSDRTQHRLDGRINLLIGDSMDVGLAGHYASSDHRAAFGLKGERRASLDIDWSWQGSPHLHLYAFAGIEARAREQGNIRGVTGSTDPNAGGAAFPLSAVWTSEMDGTSTSLGGGFSLQIFPGVTLASDYSFSGSRDEINYRFATGLALANFPAAPGTALPDLRSRDHVLETSLRIEIGEDLALRLVHRGVRSSIRDWAQTDLVSQIENRLFFAHVDRDFKASVFGIALQARF